MKELQSALSQELKYTHLTGKNNKRGNTEIVMAAFEPFISLSERRMAESENVSESLCWKTLRQIRESNYEYRIPVNLQFYQMRNIYGFIQQQTLRSWEKHNPALYVVVGTVEEDTGSPAVRLESVANTAYVLRDALNLLPGKDCYTHRANGSQVKPYLDLNAIARAAGDTSVAVNVSCAASGYYLCDYAFYHALYHGPNRALCIRLNCAGGHHSGEIEYAETVKKCITAALDQLDEQRILQAQMLM